MSIPQVIHLVISLAPGGLERLVVDWTNSRNREWPGSTRIVCLDEPGELAGQAGQGTVMSLAACRAKRPWDHAAVRRLLGTKELLSCQVAELLSNSPKGSLPSTTQQPSNPTTGRVSPTTQQPSNSTTPPNCPAILHAHNLAAWQYAVLVKLFWKAPDSQSSLRLIYTQHGANLHNFSLADRLRARILAFFTDHIVAVSAATAEVMAKTLWIPRRRIGVVVNGVRAGGGRAIDRRPQSTDLRRQLSIPADGMVIGSVGRLAYVKGHDRLIRAFAEKVVNRSSVLVTGNTNNQQPTTNNPPYLLLIGDGPERSGLEKMARELGVSNRVIFAGYQADPAPYLAAMNLFVLPSRSEGLSVSLLEAMAAGVPVAVTDVGANVEVVEEGRCGLVLSDNDAEWASQMSQVLSDPERLQAMGRRARDRVEKAYSLEATLAGYEALYNS